LVLVVDDDSGVREVTASMLHDLGYDVIEAGSGGAALDALDHNQSITVVLLDFAIPGMNGSEVAGEIRSRRPNLPILFATGYADAEAQIDAGNEMIIHKPFIEQKLAAKLMETLNERPLPTNMCC